MVACAEMPVSRRDRNRTAFGYTDIESAPTTGEPITVCTPYPLAESKEALDQFSPTGDTLHASDCLRLVLAWLASSSPTRDPDLAHASRLFTLSGPGALGSDPPGLLKVSADILGCSARLRSAHAFTGDRSIERAKYIYAAPSKVPELMESFFACGQDIYRAGNDIVAGASLVGLYLLLTHPFPNGNGRFSSACMVGLCARKEDAVRALVAASMRSSLPRHEGPGIWRRTIEHGATDYLRRSVAYERHMSAELIACGLNDLCRELDSYFTASVRNANAKRRLLTLFICDELTESQVRDAVGASAKVAKGLIDRVETIGSLERRPKDGALGSGGLRDLARSASDRAYNNAWGV